jgi:hypothetical protein
MHTGSILPPNSPVNQYIIIIYRFYMVSEEMIKRRQACPCGKGESEEIGLTGDVGEEHIMLCPVCKEKYSYDPTGVCRNHKVKMRPRGWVLNGKFDMSGALAKSV